MAIVYIINFTCPDTPAFALRPGEENGPGSGGVISTSLSLFGMGAQRWGENVNENMLHLLENYAANPVDPVPRDGFSNITLAGAPYPDVYTPGATHKDRLDYPVVGQMWYNKVIQGMMLYNGTNWVKMRGANVFPTPDPVPGDLWLDEDFHAPAHPSLNTIAQLMFWDGTGWHSVADGYVRKAGDTMFGDLQMIDASRHVYGNVGSEHMIINEGDGDVTVCPDIHKIVGDLLVASVDTVHMLFDSNGDGTGEFQVRKGDPGGPGKNLLVSDWCMRVEQDCTISVNPNLDYENLITDDDDIPNWRRVLDELLGNYLRLDGTNGPMQGDVDWGGFNLCNLADPVMDDTCAVSRGEGNDLWVNETGDTMTGTLNITVDGNTAPAICGMAFRTVFASTGNIGMMIDKDNDGTGDVFRVMVDGDTFATATGLFTVQDDGRILADTPNYETLVTSDQVLTNRKYVTDSIDAAFVARTGGAAGAGISAGERAILVWDRDVIWTGTQLLMTRGPGGATEIIWPAQYTP